MPREIDVILNDAFGRVVRFALALLVVWTALTGYVAWKLGTIEGRQRVEAVACTQTPNEVVNRKRPERIRAVP